MAAQPSGAVCAPSRPMGEQLHQLARSMRVPRAIFSLFMKLDETQCNVLALQPVQHEGAEAYGPKRGTTVACRFQGTQHLRTGYSVAVSRANKHRAASTSQVQLPLLRGKSYMGG